MNDLHEHTGVTVRDPVCGMDVAPETAAAKSSYEGQDYYFCSKGCRAKFDAVPADYLQPAEEHSCCGGHPAPRNTAPADPGALYTCPMHPEVEQIGPGSCP